MSQRSAKTALWSAPTPYTVTRMDRDDRIETLLNEILETQRAHLEEYRRVTSESLAVQRQAVEAQADHIRMYRGVALIGGVIIAVMIALAVWLILMLI